MTQSPFQKLLHSRQFWLAVAAALWNVLFYIWPTFPPELREPINIVIIALITALTVEDVARVVAKAIAPHGEAEGLETLVMPEKVVWLLRSRKFWLAMLAMIQTILFSSLPDFPPEIWQSINVVLIVVIGMMTVDDTAQHISGAWKESNR